MKALWTPTLFERIVLRFVFVFTWLSQGSIPRVVLTEFVRTMGVRPFFRYVRTSLKVRHSLQRRYGHVNAQYLIGLASLFIGCGFCTYSHVLAGAILWYEERGRLHPLDCYRVAGMFEISDEELAERLRALLGDPEHQRLLELALRMQALYFEEAEGTSPEDDYLDACLWTWRWTTECTIVRGLTMRPEQTEPNHSIGRNKQLRRRYEAALAEAGRK